jgi:hypothetical protein
MADMTLLIQAVPRPFFAERDAAAGGTGASAARGITGNSEVLKTILVAYLIIDPSTSTSMI